MEEDPLQDAYDSTKVGAVGFVKPSDTQSLDGFQAVVTAAEIWEVDGRIQIIELHRESRSGRHLVDSIQFRRKE